MLNALQLYRISARLHRIGIPIIPLFIDYVSRCIFSCWIPHESNIGKNVRVGYGGLGIVIHNQATIGDGCEIDQGVTIGGNARTSGAPTLGKSVYVGAGAKIIGPISIGDSTIIGANAVVTKSMPANCVVLGVPARIVKTGVSSDDYLYHRKNSSQR